MTTPSNATACVLTDDHVDLIVSAAAAWHVLASKTQAAFAQAGLETHVLVATSTEAGRLVRTENASAVEWLAAHGRGRLVDRADLTPYTHRPVTHLDPVEVIKAAHAAQAACSPSPTWDGSAAQRLLAAVITAGAHRLEGYADAPWSWTRPQVRTGPAVGVAGPAHPDIEDLTWVSIDDLVEHWSTAPVVVITPDVADQVPADLAPRAGVFILVVDEHPNRVWQALLALDLQALVLFWPACRPWLQAQLAHPAPEFVEHRGQ